MHIQVMNLIFLMFIGEILSLYKITDKMFSSGGKDGDVIIWVKAD